MENQQSRSKWDDLARQLGADVPVVDESQPPTSKTAAEKQASKPPAKPLPPPPKRRPADWDGLVSQLGLAPPEPARPAQPEAKPAEAEPARGPAAPVAAGRKPAQRPRGPREEIAAPREPASPAAIGGAHETAASAVEPTPPPAAANEETRQISGSVSLWHRIFGSPEEQAKKIADATRGADAAEADTAVPERSDAESLQRGMAADRTREEPEAPEAVDVAEDVGSEAVGEVADQRKKRRPRRRRRGRGHKADDQGERPAAAAAARPDRDQPLEIEEDEFDLEEVSEHDVPSTDDEWSEPTEAAAKSPVGKAKSPSHRSIPSWEETIGVLVEVNMQARSQRKQAARPSSQSGSSRGRPRGRRKKKP